MATVFCNKRNGVTMITVMGLDRTYKYKCADMSRAELMEYVLRKHNLHVIGCGLNAKVVYCM
jgi:hypothetical protein